MTLNMLRSNRMNPTLSAYDVIEGCIDYNKTPLSPPGCKVIIHEKPAQRKSWDPHGIDGWYLGPAMEHYRCYRLYATSTKAERISDTVQFFPYNYEVPNISQQTQIAESIKDLTKAVTNPISNSPAMQIGQGKIKAVKQLTKLFDTTITVPLENDQNADSQRVKKLPVTGNSQRVITHRYPTRFSQQANSAIDTETVSQPYANAIIDPTTGQSLEYRHLIKDSKTKQRWIHSFPMSWAGYHRVWALESKAPILFSAWTMIIFLGTDTNTLPMAALWSIISHINRNHTGQG